jgi:hypothetical protein
MAATSVQSIYTPACRKVTKWSDSSDETGKTEVPCHSRCGTKISFLLKWIFTSSPVMVTFPYEWKILELRFLSELYKLRFQSGDMVKRGKSDMENLD